MQQIGQIVKKGDGYNLRNLMHIKKRFEKKGCVSKLYILNDIKKKILDKSEYDTIDKAYVLVIENVIQNVYGNYDKLQQEQLDLEYDKKAFMYGRVVNKHARYNLCFDDIAQEPNYDEGKGRIIAYASMPELNKIRTDFPVLFGSKFKNMKCESNYYYDITKTGIGWHGDSERRKVVALRIGASLPLYFQWYKNNLPIGDKIKINLNGGDMYIMSEKVVGTDWKESKIYTLRHATGCDKYIT